LANAGPFDSQVHSVGPTLFYKFGGEHEAMVATMRATRRWWASSCSLLLNERRRSVRSNRCHL
jgi:hypothetical protein